MQAAFWLGKEGLGEARRKARATWKLLHKCTWPASRPILSWRKQLLRGKGSTGKMQDGTHPLLLYQLKGFQSHAQFSPTKPPVGGEGAYFPLTPPACGWSGWGIVDGDQAWSFLGEKAGGRGNFWRLFCFRVSPQADCLRFFILLSFLHEALHLIPPAAL